MKKLFVILCVCFLLVSCAENQTREDGTIVAMLQEEVNENLLVQPELTIEVIEFRGEKHEYLRYQSGYAGSYSHWEGCKYCKMKNNN